MHWAYEFLLTLPEDNVLVVSHGAVGKGLRYIIHTLHEHPEPFVNHSFKYGEITQLL
jgi:broad specificity phosphatase PhoE